jgi:predicted GNAT family N-acyltransferase
VVIEKLFKAQQCLVRRQSVPRLRKKVSEAIVVKEATTEAELQAAFDIRDKVFVQEQGIPYDVEHDEHDAGSRHVLANCGDSPIATARLTIMNDGEAVLARVAVLPEYRKSGVGRLLVRKLEELGAGAKVKRITLHPHYYLERFYAELGYSRFGGEETAGPHRLIEMEKQL